MPAQRVIIKAKKGDVAGLIGSKPPHLQKEEDKKHPLKYEDMFILPKSEKLADPSWFAYPVTVSTSKIDRHDMVKFFEEKNIQTRLMFSGNLTAHPAYKNVKYRIHGNLDISNRILKDSFFLGVYPGITKEMMNYVTKTLDDFMANIKNG